MDTSTQQAQRSECVEACELCALSPEGFKEYLANNVVYTRQCVRVFSGRSRFSEDGQKYVSGVAVCGNDRHVYTAVVPNPLECETCGPVDNAENVETTVVSEREVGSADDSEDDAWSVVSEGESIVVHENQRLLCDDDDDHDQADEESDVANDDADKSNEGDADDREYTENGEELDAGEEDIADDIDEQNGHLNSDNEEDEDLDDYTEEGIRLAEALEVQTLYREELEELKRQTLEERKHAEWRYHQMEVRTRDLHQEIEIRVEEGWRRESEYKKRQREELDAMQRVHDQRLEQIKLKLTQENSDVLKSLEVSQKRRRQDAAKSAKLCAEAADTLSAQIQEISKLKTILENTKSAYSSQTARHHKELRLLQNRLEAALFKEQNDHAMHLSTRNKLAKVEHEMDRERKNFEQQHQQAVNAGKEALQRQHETHLAAVRRSYEQELEQLKEEHEQDKAHNDGRVCELEEARFDAEYELEEAEEKVECLEQILSKTSCELQGVKDEKTQLNEEMMELQATMEELCQQAQDNKVKHEQDMRRATGRGQELEATVNILASKLDKARQEITELRDQPKEVENKEQEMKKREQQRADRLKRLRALAARELSG